MIGPFLLAAAAAMPEGPLDFKAKDMRIEPDVAQSWSSTPDGLTYTFKLRKGVKFHNGREPVSYTHQTLPTTSRV